VQVAAAITRVVAREALSADDMADTVGRIMDGEATPAQIGALLVALRMRGETVDEVVGAARAMRERAQRLKVPAGVLCDTCGTGGDGRGTFNVSTVAAIVVAAAGVRVAKHGNRALSSRAGSADLLEALGVNTQAPLAVVERCLDEVGITFLFAPAFHPATRAVAGPRREIGVRTLFNLIGPLTNPAGVTHQVVGVFDPRWLAPMAEALGQLGCRRALVVHGHGGIDELAPDGPTKAAEWVDGAVARRVLSPADFGLADEDPAGLQGGDAEENARMARAVLAGERRGAARSAVVMTAAAMLALVEGGALDEAARRAAAVIDDGRAARLLARWAEASQA
jgi:anthranilate phosphoribosyltransferase